MQVLDGSARRFANHVELTFQGILHNHIATAANEDLTNQGLFGSHSGGHGHVFVDGHISPTEEHLAFGLDGSLHLLLTGLFGGLLFGQENNAHTVLPKGGQGDAFQSHLFSVECIWNLNQNARPVSHQLVCTHRAAVVQVLQNLQGLAHDGVALLTLDVGDKAHTTSIVLLVGLVQTLCFGFEQIVL